jgi:hypothetical protein
MGQQQLFLVIIGVIIAGIAMGVGMTLFNTHAISSNKDALVTQINHLASNAYAYRTSLTTMGGGGGSYAGYAIPVPLTNTDDGTFAVNARQQSITLTGTSAQGYGSVQAVMDSVGMLASFTYSGDFQ